MGVALAKGGNVSLTAQVPGLSAVVVGLGWDARSTTGAPLDLDAVALVCGEDGAVLSDAHVVFFAHRTSPDGCVEHTGTDLSGAGEGDDEQIRVDLARAPAEVSRIVFPVAIHRADARGQTFRQVRAAHVRVLDEAGGAEIARYDLPGGAGPETALVFGELYRHGGGWKFRAVGQGYAAGLRGIVSDLGVGPG